MKAPAAVSSEQLEIGVSFDPMRGYFTTGSELRQPIVALSLGGLRRRPQPTCKMCRSGHSVGVHRNCSDCGLLTVT